PTINGIEENSDLGLGVKIFPNPSLEGTFTIQFLKASSISVTDFSGKLLLNQKVEPSTTSTIVNLSSFPNGIYFVNVKEGERVSKNQVILDISK
ncbi:MAG: T9SS C-terminal target domain-containing protein, partial [Crocinitomicaceae bacterium]|nr:T9SS C-terminal target domain-containing protein [Crocinitomicaceae bacterium]